MKVVQINATCNRGSTGKICVEVSKILTEKQIENYVLFSEGASDYPLGIKYAKELEIKLGTVESRLLGNWGTENCLSTRRLIRYLSDIKPDVVHLHNIHGHACNVKMLFNYLKGEKEKVFWTFHDCWSFTGYCTHFEMIGCKKWQIDCNNCPLKKEYSWVFDKSHNNYNLKKRFFSNLNMTIITPSKWLGNQVKNSFLKDYPVLTINNGIDLEVFRPTKSDFRKEYRLEKEFVILGVSSIWNKKKGLDVFISMSKELPNNFRIVLVGDMGKEKLPSNILSIGEIENGQKLAQIFSAVDVFVNPTREDTFPTVNMEALACGTPVVSFDSGGSSEILSSSCGVIVPTNDFDEIVKQTIRVCREKPFSKENCLEHAQKKFNRKDRFADYVKLYI